MAFSYALILVIEALVLVPFIIYSLLTSKQVSISNLDRKKIVWLACLLLIGSGILFLGPKLNLISEYNYTKLTADSWAHYFITKDWSDTGSLQGTNYQFYSKFPLTYVPQVLLHYMTGLSAFDTMTVYYLTAGISGLLLVFGISREIIKGSNVEKLIFAGIAGGVYSFLQYFNLLFAQQYPLAIGTLATLLCIYSFALLINRRKRSLIYLCISGILLALSHPFAPILISILFLVYFLLGKARAFTPNPYRGLISRRVALSMSAIAIVTGMMYTVFVTSGVFENGVRWSELNVRYTWAKVTSQLAEETVSGVGSSFEGRYQSFDAVLYPLNWALPTASSIGMLIFFLSGKSRLEEDHLHLLLPLSIVSTFLFILTFAFSFVEFAFSRYFGAFALTFNIPVSAYMIYRIMFAANRSTLRMSVLRYATVALFGMGVVASVTDPTMLPQINIGDVVYRDTKIYPTELELVAWQDFYGTVGDEHRSIRTNLNAGPVDYFKNTNGYENIIVKNPKNYTLTAENAYLVIDKDSLDLGTELQENSLLDKVYDNSEIYLGR